MMEYRVRSKRSDEWAEKFQGAQVTPEMLNVKLEGETRVLRPDGKPLAVYLPGAAKEQCDSAYPDLTRIRLASDNRGAAAGTDRVKRKEGQTRTRADAVVSGILGSFEKSPAHPSCRLTAFTAKEVDQWDRLLPFFQHIARLLEANVPDRYAAQAAQAAATADDWVIKDTPFTTITVNNTYPTGIHTDKGDLDAGFSTLVCLRRGNFTGGWITFPQYGVTADMKDGDVMLMDAHEWHGNTPLLCGDCGESLRRPGHSCVGIEAERISVVSYFRTKMTQCGTMEEENSERLSTWEARNAQKMGVSGS